jgi:hypothetical protein
MNSWQCPVGRAVGISPPYQAGVCEECQEVRALERILANPRWRLVRDGRWECPRKGHYSGAHLGGALQSSAACEGLRLNASFRSFPRPTQSC